MSNINIVKTKSYIEYLNDERLTHREDGPALIWIYGPLKGRKEWYINGLLHREDGPAVDYNNNIHIQYRFRGKFYNNIKSNEEWIKLVKKLKWEELLK